MTYMFKSCQGFTHSRHFSPNTLKVLLNPFRNTTRTATATKCPREATNVHVVTVVHSPTSAPTDPSSETSKERGVKGATPEKQEWTSLTIDWRQLPQHYLKLSKSRLTSLVVLTSMAGYAMAPAPFDLATFTLCSAGTGLLSAAANAVNQYHEVPFDAQMARTKNRILVRGHLSPLHALGFASVCASSGLTILYLGVNSLTAGLGLTNLLLYTSVYTPLKRISILNTWVGSVVGALPPLMGWAACDGSLGAGAWLLAGVLYAWQFPHFNALSWNLRPDYSRAGYRMMSVTNPGLCRRTALRYTALLVPVSLAAPWLDITHYWFIVTSLPLNTYFLYLAWRFYRHSDSSSSRKLFLFSLIQLPAFMVMLLASKKQWYSKEDGDLSNVSSAAADVIQISIPLTVKPVL